MPHFYLWDVDATMLGEGHHRELVGGYLGVDRVGHLDDPVTLLITRRQRQPVTRLKQGELERDAGQAETQNLSIVTPHSGELHLFWPPGGISLTLNRFDDHRPRKPEPEPDQKPHLPLLIDARVQGDPLPQSALGKQIGEPGRQPQSRRHSFLWVVLKTQPEHGAIGVIPVALLPFQPGVVSAGIQMRNSLAAKQDPESLGHHASSCEESSSKSKEARGAESSNPCPVRS